MTSANHNDEQQKIAGERKPLMSALTSGIILQLSLLILTALMLDGGQLFSLYLVVTIGYWLVVAIIVVRRNTNPTKADLFFIRYGSLILLALAPWVASVIYRIIGESPLNGLDRLF